jgi:hypothetical protein
MKIKNIFVILVFSLLIINTNAYGKYFWDIFDTFENIILHTDLIIVGEVTDTYTQRVGIHLKRYNTIAVDQVVSSKFEMKEKKIVIESFDGIFSNNIFEELPYSPPKFIVGQKIIALIEKVDNRYRLYANEYGKFDIINGRVENCNTPVDIFVNEIINVTQGKSNTFIAAFPSFYYLARPQGLKKPVNDPLYLYALVFRTFGDYYCFSSQGDTIQFRINPTDGRDANGDLIGFTKLKALCDSACSLWNAVDDTNIHFSVHPDSFPTLSALSERDSLSVICFEDTLQTSYGACNYFAYDPYREADITFGKQRLWNLPGQSGGTLFFKDLVHEMGHAVGLWDLGTDSPFFDSIDGFLNYQLMWA